MEKINREDSPQIHRMVKIPWELHRPILSIYKPDLVAAKSKNDAEIIFPLKESGLEDVEIVTSKEEAAKNMEKFLMVNYKF